MVERLGDVLYWASCVLAGLALLVAMVLAIAMVDTKDEIFVVLAGVLTFGLLWAIGRACRYVLAGR